jgi:hypothetical protein
MQFNDEPLLYLFYGRPAYRVNSQRLSSAIDAYAPVCLVLRPDCVASPKRIFPFDSGAFHGERFVEAMHRKMLLEDFALDPDLQGPLKLIGLFFGNHDRYYRNVPFQDVAIPPLSFEALSYHILITSRHENAFDERISAIELQSDQDLDLLVAAEAIVARFKIRKRRAKRSTSHLSVHAALNSQQWVSVAPLAATLSGPQWTPLMPAQRLHCSIRVLPVQSPPS